MEDILLLDTPPIPTQAIWGDGRLTRRYGLKVAEGADINRCPVGGAFCDFNTIKNGEFAGKSIKWLYDHHKEYFGSENEIRWDDILPISMAACWSSTDLSFQVHPREDWAQKNLGKHGKSECWYFPEVEKDTTVVCGCICKDLDELDDYISKGKWEEMAIRKPVTAGSFYAIKAGTLHSIQKGCYFIEIANPTDITFRFYDYDRLDQDGKKRPLHLRQARENIILPAGPIQYEEKITQYGDVTERFMAETEDYSAWLYKVNGKGTAEKKRPYAGCFVISGEGSVNGKAVKAGDVFMLSKACQQVILEGYMDIICCHG